MSETKSFAKKVFFELLDGPLNMPVRIAEPALNEGIIKTVDGFMTLVIEANDTYNKVFQIPQNKQIIFSEEIEASEIPTLNNNLYDENIQLYINNYLPDMRIATYTVSETHGNLGQHQINESRFKNLKWKYAGTYDDPEYTGYSIIRYTRDVEANIKFKVWGKFFQDIRPRANMLKEIIDTNIWYFKHKGLRDIIWTGSYEDIMYRETSVRKFKTQDYQIRFSEVRDFREKNLEQIVVQYGLES
jgi:hypothetical protein